MSYGGRSGQRGGDDDDDDGDDDDDDDDDDAWASYCTAVAPSRAARGAGDEEPVRAQCWGKDVSVWSLRSVFGFCVSGIVVGPFCVVLPLRFWFLRVKKRTMRIIGCGSSVPFLFCSVRNRRKHRQ